MTGPTMARDSLGTVLYAAGLKDLARDLGLDAPDEVVEDAVRDPLQAGLDTAPPTGGEDAPTLRIIR